MQLEKATSTNTEAGLAGWISSNDVTLITMVLVVIVALFLNRQLIQGRSENSQLTNVNETLNEDLGLATSERNELNDALQDRSQQLNKTREELRLSQEERDRRNQELLKAMQQIANLDQTITAIATEKATLQTEKMNLLKTRSDLESKTSTLSQQVTSLATDKESLTTETKSLNERMAALATQLEGKLKVLGELQAERDRLKEQTDKLDAIVATLEKKLTDSGTEIVAMATKADETEAEYQKRIAALEAVAGEETKRAADYLAKLKRAADIFQGLKKSNANLEEKLTDAEARYQRKLALETTVNRKLVGINGKLKRVAILFDASGSMKQKDNTEGADRWEDAQKIAGTWLGHLDVDECVLIVFSSDVRTFPGDGKLAMIAGAEGEANRAKLLAQLKSVEPEGWTNTLEALKKAYTYEGIDTILLFSDGAPTFANSGRFDPNVAEQIYTLCRQHPNIPVNTVGLGNYFDQNLSTFLRTVASVTGGTFLGR